jgi:VDE lipocalin domain
MKRMNIIVSSKMLRVQLLLYAVIQIIIVLTTLSPPKHSGVFGFQIQIQQQKQLQYNFPLLHVNNQNNGYSTSTTTRCNLWKKNGRLYDDETSKVANAYNNKSTSSCPLTTKISTTNLSKDISQHFASILLSISILLSSSSILLTVPMQSYATTTTTDIVSSTVLVSDSSSSTKSTTTNEKSYDGFAEYAKDNQMEQSDVSCFINKCGIETKELFQNPRGIKGIVCLGQCKGEQVCATRCFAEYGSTSLNNWLSCTIEDNECVKVPKSIDNSAEDIGYTTTIKNFNPSSLVGTWYKTDGLNPNYDLFDCQTNTFELSSTSQKNSKNELDMGIFFRIQRPIESGGGYWENSLTEHMVVDSVSNNNNKAENVNDNVLDTNDMNSAGRTMHTSGKMYGLQFSENWYILGESDGSNNIPEFKLVAYKGHTLQGNYEGAFVYAKQPILPESAKAAVSAAATKAGLDFTKFIQIDNTCPSGLLLNDSEAGTGTSTNDWIQLLIGEGGVIDWISPGWRGEYKNTQ